MLLREPTQVLTISRLRAIIQPRCFDSRSSTHCYLHSGARETYPLPGVSACGIVCGMESAIRIVDVAPFHIENAFKSRHRLPRSRRWHDVGRKAFLVASHPGRTSGIFPVDDLYEGERRHMLMVSDFAKRFVL